MAWVSLIIAGLFEAFGVAMMNQLHVKRNWQTIVLLVLGFGSSFLLLGYSLRFLPMEPLMRFGQVLASLAGHSLE